MFLVYFQNCKNGFFVIFKISNKNRGVVEGYRKEFRRKVDRALGEMKGYFKSMVTTLLVLPVESAFLSEETTLKFCEEDVFESETSMMISRNCLRRKTLDYVRDIALSENLYGPEMSIDCCTKHAVLGRTEVIPRFPSARFTNFLFH